MHLRIKLTYLIMEISQIKLLVQFIISMLPGFLYLQLTNHVSGRLAGIALVSSDLKTTSKKHTNEWCRKD